MVGLRTISFTASDLDDLADQFQRMSEAKASGPANRPAASRHYDNGSANAYAKCAEIVRALAAPARERPSLRVVANGGECV